MNKHKSEFRVCVLGNFSGRNAGDIAILGNLIRDIDMTYPGVRFVVPTMNPGFLRRSFPCDCVEPVSLQPWALSLKIFGLPIFRAVLSSDLVLVTDNILFDMKLFNPLFNYLSTLSLVLPIAKWRGIPVVLYNMSLGPISTPSGKFCFDRVIRSCELIILRDQQSLDLIGRLGIPHGPVELKADCAVNTQPCKPQRLEAIIQEESLFQNRLGTIGFNINAYLDAYLNRDGSSSNPLLFTETIARTVDRVIEHTGMDILFIVTQVMDMKITADVLRRIQCRDRVKVISNKKYAYDEIAAVMGRLELLVGMRTHALILATAMNTPVVGIISYPKTAGYLKTIEQDPWTIKFSEVDVDPLLSLILAATEQRDQIRLSLEPGVEREKKKARESAVLLSPFLLPKLNTLGVAGNGQAP